MEAARRCRWSAGRTARGSSPKYGTKGGASLRHRASTLRHKERLADTASSSCTKSLTESSLWTEAPGCGSSKTCHPGRPVKASSSRGPHRTNGSRRNRGRLQLLPSFFLQALFGREATGRDVRRPARLRALFLRAPCFRLPYAARKWRRSSFLTFPLQISVRHKGPRPYVARRERSSPPSNALARGGLP